MILNALAEKTPQMAICRTFKVSPNTVYALLKSVEALSPLQEALLHDEVVIDELWTFIKCKQNGFWV